MVGLGEKKGQRSETPPTLRGGAQCEGQRSENKPPPTLRGGATTPHFERWPRSRSAHAQATKKKELGLSKLWEA